MCSAARPTPGKVERCSNGEGGIRTLEGGNIPLNALAGRRLQPLGHFSGRHRIAALSDPSTVRSPPRTCKESRSSGGGRRWYCRDVRGEPASTFLPAPPFRHMPLKGDFLILRHEAPHRQARGERLEPGQGLLPEARADEDRPRRVLPRRRGLRAQPRPAPAHADVALPRRRGGVVLLPEAGSGRIIRDWLETVHIEFPSGRTADFPVCNERRGARVDRQSRLHRSAHVGLAGGRRRPAGLPPDRSRPERGQSVAPRAEDRDGRQGGDGRARARRASRRRRARPGSTSSRRSSRSWGSPRCGALRRPSLRRSSGGSTIRSVATTTWKVADRRGVFVDYGQNSRDRTIASAYSIRPTPDARASTPLDWDEVADGEGGAFHADDDAQADRRGRRPDQRHVAPQSGASIPLFAKLDLEPADPNKLESGRRGRRGQRWESDPRGGQPRRPAQQAALRRAKK